MKRVFLRSLGLGLVAAADVAYFQWQNADCAAVNVPKVESAGCYRLQVYSSPCPPKESDFSLSYSSPCPPKESDLSLSCHFQNLSTGLVGGQPASPQV